MKKLLFLLCIVIASLSLLAQAPARMPANGNARQAPPAIGHVYGKLVDSSGKSIGAASVVFLQNRFDTATKKSKEILLKGTSTQANGDFSMEELPVMGSLKIMFSATGYQPFTQTVSFMPAGNGQNNRPAPAAGNGSMSFDKNLGKVMLKTDVQQLQGITVVSTNSRLRMDIDKKVFNVDKNIVTAGGTGLDVMRNVPSVNVDIDGNISLRNATPQLFVDGRPTTLTLEQIPADAIESVEVITNPSAKYDASGGGAGILNVVLKKNKRTGYNGNLRAGIDRLGAVNGGVDFNARQGKVNFFGSLNVNQRKSNTEGSVSRLNIADNPQTLINQLNDDQSKGRFIFARAGLDYFITNRTTLSLAAFRMNAKFKPNELISIATDSMFSTGTIKSYSERTSPGDRAFNGRGLSFGMKHLFAKEGEEWTADANYFSGDRTNSNLYSTNFFTNGAGSSVNRTLMQKILSGGNDQNLILQTDYIKPVSTKSKLETGLRAQLREFENNNSNYYLNSNTNDYVLIPSTTGNYINQDYVYAAYVSWTSSIKKFGYKVGLRAESSSYEGELMETKQKFSNSYPVSLFPSVFLSQKLSEKDELQASFTRRINRPNFFQLIPFADYTDELNITQGNPDLVPEFTASTEMSYSKTFNKNNNFLASIYYKKTDDLITRYLVKGENPFTSKEAIINTYINAASSQSYGTELTSQNFLNKWLDITTNVNIYNGSIKTDQSSGNSLWSWFGKFNSNFKLPSEFTVQLSATYQSKTILTPGSGGGFGGPPGARGGSGGGPGGGGGFGQAQSAAQGYIEPSYGIDLAVRKNFLKNNALSATLSVSDIFRTRNFNQYSESAFFIQNYNRLRDPQMVRLTLAYRFGKVDATLFKRKNMRSEEGSMQGM